MKKKHQFLWVALFLLLELSSCSDYTEPAFDNGSKTSGSNQSPQAGLITAGEWNDLEHWAFWSNLMDTALFANQMDHWQFYPNHRISVTVMNNGTPLIGRTVTLKKENSTIWETQTDNFGKAELWIELIGTSLVEVVNLENYDLYIDGQLVNITLVDYENGINQIDLNTTPTTLNNIELCFIVDATSSMSDELRFLKEDFFDVIERAESSNPSLSISTASLFYRDEGDAYITKRSEFTTDKNITKDFIDNQRAAGGGNYPEAVHSALDSAINVLQWSTTAKAKIAFLILDAPPHYQPEMLASIHSSIQEAARKGIKIIPVAGSGINKETEFLTRFFALATNGTYVFITDDSGIGSDHLEATVGEYEVEFLNDLMVRLIVKYSE